MPQRGAGKGTTHLAASRLIGGGGGEGGEKRGEKAAELIFFVFRQARGGGREREQGLDDVETRLRSFLKREKERGKRGGEGRAVWALFRYQWKGKRREQEKIINPARVRIKRKKREKKKAAADGRRGGGGAVVLYFLDLPEKEEGEKEKKKARGSSSFSRREEGKEGKSF